MDAARGTLTLARAASISEAQAAEITGNAINTFGLKAKDSTVIVDELAAAANSSSVEIGDVSAAFQMAASVFSGFQGPAVGAKESMTELNTAIAILGNNGIKGSDAGTSLKQMLLQLTGPSKRAKDAMFALNIEAEGGTVTQGQLKDTLYESAKAHNKAVAAIQQHNMALSQQGDIAFDGAGKMRPLRDIIDRVTRATKNMSDEDRDFAITQIFGADASRSVIALMKGGLPTYDAQRKAVLRVGAAADVAAAKNKGLRGSIDNVRSQLENAAIAIYTAVKGPLTKALNGLATDLSNTFGFIGKHTGALKDLATVLGIVGGAFLLYRTAVKAAELATIAFATAQKVLAFIQLASEVRSFAGAWAVLDAAMAANPIGLVIVAIAALVAGIILAWKHSQTFRTVVLAVWGAVKTGIGATVNWIVGTVWPALVAVWHGIAAGAKWMWDNVIHPVVNALVVFFKSVVAPTFTWLWRNVAEPVFHGIARVVQVYIAVARLAIAIVIAWFRNVVAPTWLWLWHNVAEPVFKGIAAVVRVQIAIVRGVLTAIIGFLRGTFGPVFTWLWRNVIGPAWNGIKAAVSAAWNFLKPILAAMIDGFKNRLVSAFHVAVDGIKRAWSIFKDVVKAPVVIAVRYVINPLIHGFNTLAHAFGTPTVAPISGFAEGGMIPGPASDRDNRWAFLRDKTGRVLGTAGLATGEFVVNARDTAKALPLLNWINDGMKGGGPRGAEQRIGRPMADMPGDGSEGWAFASGGIVGFLKNVWNNVAKPVKFVVKSAWDAVTNPAKLLKAPLEAALRSIPGGPAIRGLLVGMGHKLINGLVNWATGAGGAGGASAYGGPITARLARTMSFIRAQDGKPYVWASAGPRGYDCCIVKGVRIYGPDGAKPIEDVRAGDRVFSYVDGRVEAHTVVKAWQSIHQPVFAVRTRNRTVTASANHPFLRVVDDGTEEVRHHEQADWPGLPDRKGGSRKGLTCSLSTCDGAVHANGMCATHQARWRKHGDPRVTVSTRTRFATQWARLDELQRGDLLVQPRVMAADAKPDACLTDGTAVDPDVAWLIGAAVGDGTVTDKGLRLCLFGDDRERASRIITDRWGSNPTHGAGYGLVVSSAALRDALTGLGMRCLGPDKRVPEAAWTWPDELRRAFLDGYCDADGHRPADQKRHGERTYSSASRELIEDVRAMHVMLGSPVSNIRTTERTKPITIKGKLVRNARPQHTFAVWPDNGHGEARMRTKPGLAAWLDGGEFTLTAVLAIDPKGEADTWDLNIEGSHNFVADGVVVHNSGIVSAAYNLMKGRSPYSHTFSTESAAYFFPRPGANGPLAAAWSHPGQRPADNFTGHMMGRIGNLTFESTGSRGVHLGRSTRRLSDFAHIGHFADGGMVRLANMALADSGRLSLAPGWNLVGNGTGAREHLSAGGGEVHVHFHNSIVTSERQAEDMVVKAVTRAKAGNRL
jgi:TP901 family phage tail tape measure protein